MNKKFAVQSTFLGGLYTNKRKLGKGAFGDVFLVEDGKKELYALKVIDKQKLEGQNEDMIQYLKGEKSLMENMNHKNLVKLYDFKEDEGYYYMILQYCDGGDLVNIQATFPNRVFSLQIAAKYLSQVILGLQELHSHHYLHRDIKLQNVLVKNQNGDKVLKVADFGFAKKAFKTSGTVLGTQQYMSPQIYRCGIEQSQGDDIYGYQVDMWAFGVLFYYMLNMSFPFQINPHWTIEMKYKQLSKQAQNFSYKKVVTSANKKILENCTEQVEDLFRKIFHSDVTKRINFHQIRQHPIFAKHFPKASIESQILYKNKFVSGRLKKGKNGVTNNLVAKQSQLSNKNVGLSYIGVHDQQKDFPQQKQILRLQLQQIGFLLHTVDEIQLVQQQIGSSKSYMFAYNLIKYYIILLNGHLKNLNASYYVKKYKQLNFNWNFFFDTDHFKSIRKQVALKISKAEMRFQELYTKCNCQLKQIVSLNDSFKNAFVTEVDPEEMFDGDFHRSYRKSTDNLYITLKEILKTHKINKFYYFLCAVCICHVFNEFYEDPSLKQKIFSAYLTQQTQKTPIFSYERFVYYLKTCGKQNLVLLTRRLIEEVMMNC